MAELQKKLQKKYRTIFAIEQILVDNNNNYIFNGDVINESLIINNNCICNNLFVSDNANISSDIVVSNISTNNIFINDSIHTSNITSNNLLVRDKIIVNNDFYCNNTYSHINNTSNNIVANNINCINITATSIVSTIPDSDANSIINIKTDKLDIYANNIIFNGTTINILTEQLYIKDKNIISNTEDRPGYHSMNILGISGNGFIRIDDNIQRYQIKAPLNEGINYMVEIDKSENIYISGKSNINNITVMSNININDNSVFNSDLNVSDFINIKTDLTILKNTYLNNITVGNTSKVNLNISSMFATCNNLLCDNLSINSSMYINKSAILTNMVTNNLTCDNINNINYTVNDIIKSNNLLTKNNMTISSNLFVSTQTTIYNDLACKNLNIQRDLTIKTMVSIPTNITVLGNINVNVNSLLNNININGVIVIVLPHFANNYAAALGGLEDWEIYRTGGIVKIKLDISPPVLHLEGGGTIAHSGDTYNSYTEPGVSALDEDDGYTPVYIVSVKNSNNVEFLNSSILYTNQLDINLNAILTPGTYIIYYESTDVIGNVGRITRELIV